MTPETVDPFVTVTPPTVPGVAVPMVYELLPVPPLLPPDVDWLGLQPGPPPLATTVPNEDDEPALPHAAVPSLNPAPPAPTVME